jgi:adenylylsulfate kinase (apsK)
MSQPFTMLLTGLSGAGKSTIAKAIFDRLDSNGHRIEVLDGDIVREEIGHLFGYSREERLKVSRVLRFTAKLLNKNGVSVVIAAISPYQEMRDQYRAEMKDYVEVYVKCPLEVCVDRDTKGMYKKALRGDIKNVIGVDEPFEIPKDPNIVVDSAACNIDAVTNDILKWLVSNHYV